MGRFGSEPGVEVVVRCRRAEAVEIHCHGGHSAVAMIQGMLLEAGCRSAAWQERLADETAEPIAVAARLALAEARTLRTAAILLDQLHGALGREMKAIQAAISRRQWQAAGRQIDTLLARARWACISSSRGRSWSPESQRRQKQPHQRPGGLWAVDCTRDGRHHAGRCDHHDGN